MSSKPNNRTRLAGALLLAMLLPLAAQAQEAEAPATDGMAEEAAPARRPREEAAASNEGTPGIEGEEIAGEERNPFVRQERGQRARSRGRNRPANGTEAADQGEEAGFDAAVLPPSISRDEEAPRQPRTRSRRSRPADDGGEETLEAVGG